MPFNHFLDSQGIMYDVLRDGNIISKCKGLPNKEKGTNIKYIGFKPQTDIQEDDVLINPAGDKVYVAETQTQFFNAKPYQLKVFFTTEKELQAKSNQAISNTIFNIENATNSIIGNYSSAIINIDQAISDIRSQIPKYPQDKEELEQLVTLIEMITNDKIPTKKGILSNFADTIAKHSWITGPIAQAVISWLMSQM